MIYLDKNSVIDDFFAHLGLNLEPDIEMAVKNFITGLIVNERGSINDIATNTIGNLSERQLNRALHKVKAQSDLILDQTVLKLQETPKLAIKPSGVISLDEHIVPKSGQKIEGVDYFYSPTDKKTRLGLSMISTHYYGGDIEYPLGRAIYRRERELAKRGKSAEYKSKNQIARELIQYYATFGFPCKMWTMDSYFMTKENVKELKAHGMSYVARVKRNWGCTYVHKHWTISSLYASIPDAEYEVVQVRNPKTKAPRYFKVAVRDVFIKKIGNNRLVFQKELKLTSSGTFEEKYPGEWRCIVTDRHDMTTRAIIETYLKRWAIETGYRDENQQLKLHSCMWRDIEGQYCYITLVFIAYMLLCWASYVGYLDLYAPKLKTLGDKRAAFKRLNDELFGEWISQLKKDCPTCRLSQLIYQLIYGVNNHHG
mgnify:CR=1 FL=1